MTVSEKRDHSTQNVHSSYKHVHMNMCVSIEIKLVELQVNIPRDSMIASHARVRALQAVRWLPRAFKDAK